MTKPEKARSEMTKPEKAKSSMILLITLVKTRFVSTRSKFNKTKKPEKMIPNKKQTLKDQTIR